jgi:hypothetical protein
MVSGTAGITMARDDSLRAQLGLEPTPHTTAPSGGALYSVLMPRVKWFTASLAIEYLGYSLRVRGYIGGEAREFLVGVGEGAHAKHQLRAGDSVSGDALPVVDPRVIW